MKKTFKLFILMSMMISLVACGGTKKESAVVTTENWNDYFEFVVETNTDQGFLDYQVYLKAKDGITISNETNTIVYFSHHMDQQQYTKQNDEIILGEKETLEESYTSSINLFKNDKNENFNETLDTLEGGQWSFNEGDCWTNIPHSFEITKIDGTINVEY